MTDATINRDLEIVRAACLRHGQSPEDADQVVTTCVVEYREGDTRLFDLLLERALLEIH